MGIEEDDNLRHTAVCATICTTPLSCHTAPLMPPKKPARKRRQAECDVDPFTLDHECLTSHQFVQVEKVLGALIDQTELRCDEVLQCMNSMIEQIVAKRIRYRGPPKEKLPSISKKELANMFCYCGYGDGYMIGCEGEKCPGNNWYHLECVGLRTEPRGTWYCQTCAERKAIKEKERKLRLERYSKRPRKETQLSEIDDTKFVVSRHEKTKALINPLRVEAAERQSREEMDSMSAKSKRLEFSTAGKVINKEKNDDFPNDLCKFKLPDEDFRALQSLHRFIVKSLNSNATLTPWAGVGESDQRKRGYAFLPHSYGKFGKTALQNLGVNFHAAEKRGAAAKNDESANWKSCFRIKESDLSPEYLRALNIVIKIVKNLVPSKYQHVITLNQLHALQPNLHNGLDHLPAHIDSPLNDGFGVVIVTICVHQDADIIMLSNRSNKSWVFNVQEGETYVLSGDSRNVCDHGVICPLQKRSRRSTTETEPPKKKQRKRKGDPENVGRESLNLRFGIHGNKPGSTLYYLDEMPENVLID